MINSDKMSLAERLAQKLKTSPMGELLDEDDLGDLCRRAIEDAFFKKKHVARQYGGFDVHEPEIVAEARKIFKEAMAPLIIKAGEELVADPKFKALLLETAIQLLPTTMMDAARGMISQAAMMGSRDAVAQASELARNGLLGR